MKKEYTKEQIKEELEVQGNESENHYARTGYDTKLYSLVNWAKHEAPFMIEDCENGRQDQIIIDHAYNKQ